MTREAKIIFPSLDVDKLIKHFSQTSHILQNILNTEATLPDL